MILFLDGQEVARTSGAMSATQIVRWAATACLLPLSEFAMDPGTDFGNRPQATSTVRCSAA